MLFEFYWFEYINIFFSLSYLKFELLQQFIMATIQNLKNHKFHIETDKTKHYNLYT